MLHQNNRSINNGLAVFYMYVSTVDYSQPITPFLTSTLLCLTRKNMRLYWQKLKVVTVDFRKSLFSRMFYRQNRFFQPFLPFLLLRHQSPLWPSPYFLHDTNTICNSQKVFVVLCVYDERRDACETGDLACEWCCWSLLSAVFCLLCCVLAAFAAACRRLESHPHIRQQISCPRS